MTALTEHPPFSDEARAELVLTQRRLRGCVQEQQGVGVAPEATNRQMRRRLEKAQKNARRGGR